MEIFFAYKINSQQIFQGQNNDFLKQGCFVTELFGIKCIHQS